MTLDGIAALRQLLLDAEKSLGLEQLSEHERDVYYATVVLSNQQKELSASNIFEHELACELPRATFYRVLKKLVQNNFLAAPLKKNGTFKLLKR